ncbi:MAG: hypothetical protein GY798_20515 [Hyphomicrobiales bacterium]|nr:hypothetical protein [Hyphomicrobiales bacterium]
MAFMLKIKWNIADGKVPDFKAAQEELCAVMSDDHSGVICYLADYPEDSVSEWIEIYANDDVFRAHLANERGQKPLQTLVESCDSIECRCFGDPDAASREILAGFGAVYNDVPPAAFIVHPRADRDSST